MTRISPVAEAATGVAADPGSLRALEYAAIVERLAGLTAFEPSRELARALEPVADAVHVGLLQDQTDEAAPRDPVTGEYVGAKTYTQLNLEFEQALTRKWTVVAFFDAVGTAIQLEDYPFSEKLYSSGLCVLYNTVIGPVRLEYGHNLNPRPLDPSGTLLFSIGYPF